MSDSARDDGPTEEEVLAFLEERFADNLTVLETEQQFRVNAYVKEQARLQVLLYWRKLQDLARRVTESEVPITLSNQKTPEGRTFSIFGVADLVEEAGRNVLYDIKTHDPDFVVQNKPRYEDQLNIYARIWSQTHQKPVHDTAVIATPVPAKVAKALQTNNQPLLNKALAEWNPIIPLGYREQNVDQTLAEFARTVDQIENRRFDPVAVSVLEAPLGSGTTAFGRKICRNCDIRFACDSYRAYALKHRRTSTDDLLGLMADLGEDHEVQAFKALASQTDNDKAFEASTRPVEEEPSPEEPE